MEMAKEELADRDADSELHCDQLLMAVLVAAVQPVGVICMRDVINQIIPRNNFIGLTRRPFKCQRHPHNNAPGRSFNADLPPICCHVYSSDEVDQKRPV